MHHDIVEKLRQRLDSFSVSDYHGLDSPGLTCYLNSVLQVLFMTEDFREAVKKHCIKDSATIDPHLGRLFTDLQKSAAETHHIIEKLAIKNVYEERDAAEYFEKILCLSSPEAAKIFKGELNHRTICRMCHKTTDSRSFFWLLPLVVEDLYQHTYSVEEGLKAFFQGDKAFGDDKMYCSHCNKKQDADFGCQITQSPDVLTLLLKRFSFDSKHRCYFKLCSNVEVPQCLHLENWKYDLYAIVHHFGDLTGGHYTAQIKSFETNEWYDFNDKVVKMVRKRLSLISRTAYLIMYKKVNRHYGSDIDGNQETLSAHRNVETEGRRKGSGREEPLAAHHPVASEIHNTMDNLQDFKNDEMKKHGHNVSNKLPKVSRQDRKADVKSHEETVPDGDPARSSSRTSREDFAKPQKERCRLRQQLDTSSDKCMCQINTGGSSTARSRSRKVDHLADPRLKD